MSKFKKRPTDRFLAATLSLALTACFTPLSVFAEPDSIVTTTVKNSDTAPTEPFSKTGPSKPNKKVVFDNDNIQEDDSKKDQGDSYIVRVNCTEEYKNYVEVSINNETKDQYEFKVGEKSHISVKVKNPDGSNVRIDSVKIGGINLFSDTVTGKASVSGEINFNEEIASHADASGTIDINVSLVQMFGINFDINPSQIQNGGSSERFISADETSDSRIGTCILNDHNGGGFKAVAENGYCITMIEVDGKCNYYNTNTTEVSVEGNQLGVGDPEAWFKSHNIKVFFGFSKIHIDIDDDTPNGKIVLDERDVEKGSTADIRFVPDPGCFLRSVLVDDEPIGLDQLEKGIYKLENVLITHKVSAVFQKETIVTIDLPKLEEPFDTYKDDVLAKLNIAVQDESEESEIEKIEYWLNTDSTHKELDIDEREILIDDVKDGDFRQLMRLNVMITDKGGHTTHATSGSFAISKINPTIRSIEFNADPNQKKDGSAFFLTETTATVIIDDKNRTIFDKELYFDKYLAMFKISKDGVELTDEQKREKNMISLQKVRDSLIAKITFSEDGKYDWSIDYINNAERGCKSDPEKEGKNTYSFSVDRTPPEGNITPKEYDFGKQSNKISFTKFEDAPVTLKVETEETHIYYYTDYTVAADEVSNIDIKKREELEALYEDSINEKRDETVPPAFVKYDPEEGIVLEKNRKAIVYVRIEDGAGNATYDIKSTGIIIDDIPLDLKITKKNKTEDEDTLIHNGVVEFEVNVAEQPSGKKPEENQGYAGINEIQYAVFKNGKIIGEPVTLYKYSTKEESKLCLEKKDLVIRLDPRENPEYNSDDLTVQVWAYDNIYDEDNEEYEANGVNKRHMTTASAGVSINIDELDSSIEFVDESYNEKRVDPNAFTKRSAIFRIKNDRSTSFDEEAATNALLASITVENLTDKSGNALKGLETSEVVELGEWVFDSEKKEHSIRVDFPNYGIYTITKNEDTVYENKAHNRVDLVKETLPFTIDNTVPSGKLSINDGAWVDLLKVLTFGAYTSDKYVVEAEAKDAVSRVEISYYISHDETPLDRSQLDNVEWSLLEGGSFTIDQEEKYVVYIRLMDMAGNYEYICSDGHIIDSKAPAITLTPPPAFNENEAYNSGQKRIYNCEYLKDGIIVNVNVEDAVPYSGLKSVQYEVLAGGNVTQSGTLYEFTKTAPSYSDLRSNVNENVIIDPELNNSSDVILRVTCEDNAGNVSAQEIQMDIDITAPTISISYDNNNDNGGNGYFNNNRTATIVVNERSQHFSKQNARDRIKITAVDVNGNNVDNAYEISDWVTKNGETPDTDTHTITIGYNKDANYTFEISYTDAAGNESTIIPGNSIALNKFTVDKTPPTGSITALSDEGMSRTWQKLVERLFFGFWSNSNINISATHSDMTSPIASVDYYKLSSQNGGDASTVLTVDDLNSVAAWTPFSSFDVKPNEQFTVYLRIVDMAGNTTYISTNGLIVDNEAPHQEFTAPEITITPEQSESGIYNGDVKLDINVNDPLVGGTYSGLRNIHYRVLNMGVETQNGVLYDFETSDPDQASLMKSWNGEVVVSSQLNNSNDVVVEVYAEDNAKNATEQRFELKIDTTPPAINVSYNNNASNDKLYKGSRTARISISERNFNDKYVNILVNGERYQPGAWSSSGGSGNGDDTVWYAEVPFTADGDYTFDISCTDLASNKNTEVNYGDSTNPTAFTIDSTNPAITVEFIEGNNEHNGTYYQKARKARITIDELHFDPVAAKNGVKCNVVVDKHDGKGVEKDTAVLSEWSRVSGTDKYVATIDFAQDAQYTLNVSYTDQAGNAGQSYSESFIVDTSDPRLDLSVNGSPKRGAYAGAIEALISFDDTNFDPDSLKLSMSAANVNVSECNINGNSVSFKLKNTPKGENKTEKTIEWTGTITDVVEEGSTKVYGKQLKFNNFPEGIDLSVFDDIYTLSVSLADKAGRTVEKELTFSVNRFGSTYDISRISDVLGTYTKVSPKIVISEINPDELTDYSVTLFKNNETITLNNGQYDVEVIGDANEWHEYIYTIPESNFADDGLYSISIHSVDKAKNVSENTLDTKESDISFAVDNTPPKAMVANLESDKTYAENSRRIIMTADDNILLSSIEVYLDGEREAYKTWNQEEISQVLGSTSEGEREFSFDIDGDSTKAHSLKIICTDAAGNPTELSFKNFYVTTNMWIRFVNNKLALFGSILGAVALIGGGFMIAKKKRRRH